MKFITRAIMKNSKAPELPPIAFPISTSNIERKPIKSHAFRLFTLIPPLIIKKI
jgi:hypothetical protein